MPFLIVAAIVYLLGRVTSDPRTMRVIALVDLIVALLVCLGDAHIRRLGG